MTTISCGSQNQGALTFDKRLNITCRKWKAGGTLHMCLAVATFHKKNIKTINDFVPLVLSVQSSQI